MNRYRSPPRLLSPRPLPQSPRPLPGTLSGPFVAGATRSTVEGKYCSCLFKVTASNYRRGYTASPYAICTASVINRRGLRGPGSAGRCKYTSEYLEGLPTSVLYDYAMAKNLVRPRDSVSRDDLLDTIEDFFSSEG